MFEVMLSAERKTFEFLSTYLGEGHIKNLVSNSLPRLNGKLDVGIGLLQQRLHVVGLDQRQLTVTRTNTHCFDLLLHVVVVIMVVVVCVCY